MADRRDGVDETLLGKRYERPKGEEGARAADESTFVGRFARELSPLRIAAKVGRYTKQEAQDAGRDWDKAEPGLERLAAAADFVFSPFTAALQAMLRDPVLAATGDMRKAKDAENAAWLASGYRELARSGLKSMARGLGDGAVRTAGRTVGYPAYGAVTMLPTMEDGMPETDGAERGHGLYAAYGDLRGASRALPPLGAPEFGAVAQGHSTGGKVDRRRYYERVPQGWTDPYSQAVQDYISTELDGDRQIRPTLRRGKNGIDPLNESRARHWDELEGYEDGGEVEEPVEDAGEYEEEIDPNEPTTIIDDAVVQQFLARLLREGKLTAEP